MVGNAFPEVSEQAMELNYRQLFGILGIGLGGVAFVLGFLLFLEGSIGLWLFLLIALPSGILLLISSVYLLLEYQTLAVLRGPS